MYKEVIIMRISEVFPCREQLIRELFSYLPNRTDAVPNGIHIFGHNQTGKTTIIRTFLGLIGDGCAYIDCIQCYSSKIIYESILNQLFDHKLDAKNGYAPYAKCDNGRDLITNLRALDRNRNYVICLDDAERLRDMDAYILPVLSRLQELTNLKICCVYVTVLPPENMIPIGGLATESIPIYWPQYKPKEYLKILLTEYCVYIEFLKEKLNANSTLSESEMELQMKIIDEELDGVFFENYLKMFITLFYQTHRAVSDLLLISLDCFYKYCEPVLNGLIGKYDVKNLYGNVHGMLKASMSSSYKKIEDSCNRKDTQRATATAINNSTIQQFELPYYGKFLLIAAYLASHNESKLDRRLFMKHHGKQKKKIRTMIANAKVAEKLSTQLGPKSFSIDRLLAIFYAIIEEKVSLSCTLLAQISSLVHLKLLVYHSGENNIMEGTARLMCTVSLEFIRHIGASVGFNVCQYLSDFI